MAKVLKFLTPRRALPFFNSSCFSDFPFYSSCCCCYCCCCRFGAEKLKTMRIPLAALLRLEWTYFSLPSLVFFFWGSPLFFCIIKKVLYIFCWHNGGVGVYLHLAVGCVKRLVLPWRRSSRARGGGARRRGWSKNLLLVLKFLILCYLATQTICCQWEYPSMEGERISEREREMGRKRGQFYN